MSTGAMVDELRHACRKAAAGSVAQIRGDRGCRQRFQHQLRTLCVRPQIGEESAQWMCAPTHFVRSVGAENQDVSRITLARHVCQPRKRRPIAPVQIFEDEDERAPRGERLQRISQLPQHLRWGDAFSRADERGSVGRIEHRGQVREPARGILAQSGHEAIAFRVPAQAAQRLQQRTIGFAHPIVIDALTAPH